MFKETLEIWNLFLRILSWMNACVYHEVNWKYATMFQFPSKDGYAEEAGCLDAKRFLRTAKIWQVFLTRIYYKSLFGWSCGNCCVEEHDHMSNFLCKLFLTVLLLLQNNNNAMRSSILLRKCLPSHAYNKYMFLWRSPLVSSCKCCQKL